MNQTTFRHRQQRGAVLMISLVMLLIITLLGITGMETTVLEEKMAGNMRAKSTAFQAAESALRNGEMDIKESDVSALSFLAACTSGFCLPAASIPVWEDATVVNWTSAAQTIEYGTRLTAANIGGLAAQPKYILEKLDAPAAVAGQSLDASASTGYTSPAAHEEVFRITARGVGGTATAVAMVQSIYKK